MCNNRNLPLRCFCLLYRRMQLQEKIKKKRYLEKAITVAIKLTYENLEGQLKANLIAVAINLNKPEHIRVV